MRVPLAATLICLCGAASAATCDRASLPEPPQARQPGQAMILAAMPLPALAPAAQAIPPARPAPHDERGLLLAGLAWMAAIALRRTGGPR